MIQVSNDFITALEQPTREWRAKLVENGTDTGATIKSITVQGGSMTESTFNFCGCYSMSFTAIVDSNNYIFENKDIDVQLGLVLADESVEWISLGTFTVTDVEAGKYATTIKGAGLLSSKGGLEFTPPTTQTIANIVTSASTIMGATINIDSTFDTSVTVTKPMLNLTCMEALNVVASVIGGFVTDKADGTIYIGKYPTNVTYSVDASRMTEEPTFADYDVEITGVHVIVSEASQDEDGTPIPAVEYVSGTPNFAVVNPYMTQEAFTQLANNLIGLTWRTGRVPLAMGDPRLEATDLLAVTVDSTVNVPCHNFSHTFDGGLKTIITALGDSESLAESQQTGAITRQLKEISADIVRANAIITQELTVGDHFFVGSDGKIHITETENDFTTGNNILIDSDSVDIRDGTTTLASFGSTTRIGEGTKTHIDIDFRSLQLKDAETNTFFYIGDLRNEQGYYETSETFTGNGSRTLFYLLLPAQDTSYTVTLNGVDASSLLRVKRVDYFDFTEPPADGDVITVEYKTDSPKAKVYTAGLRKESEPVGIMSFAEGLETVASGFATHAEGNKTTSSGDYSHSEGSGTTASSPYSHAEGCDTTASGSYSHAEGYKTKASSPYSHAEGCDTTASGIYSHAEGDNTTASGAYSHAEGTFAQAVGFYSHAEGSGGWARGDASHAEGSQTEADGNSSHAEGLLSYAEGDYSHAQNEGTIASGNSQTALGKYNIKDTNNEYAVIVGNGTDDNNRSNALTVDWSGNVVLSGDLTDGSGNALSNVASKVTALQTWTTQTYTFQGLSITVKYNNAIPTLLRVKVYGTLNAVMNSASAYVTIASTGLTIPVPTLGYVQLNAIAGGQLRITSGGDIQIGYTRNYGATANSNLASGAGVYIDQALIVG